MPIIEESAITFAGGLRDRADRLRGDPALLRRFWNDPEGRVLPLWRGKPLLEFGAETIPGWLPTDAALVAEATEPPVFLGLAEEEGRVSGRFAIDVSAWQDPAAPDGPPPAFRDETRQSHPSLPGSLQFADLRAVMAQLSTQDAADAATAKGVLEWHRSHTFCSRCGASSEMANGGWRRECPACGGQHFPRTDPVVIMLITRGDHVLVGRQPAWPRGMFSLLAGFMEPGETMEGAVRREVSEETNVRVGRVAYVASQPWPFPASLMIGCAGEALSEEIEIDPTELEHAMWVSREEMRESLAGKHPALAAARPGAIARSVIEAWVEGRIPPFD
ncbi:MAG: NAD(+) diphosphatase [Pseudomonadota bacterium]